MRKPGDHTVWRRSGAHSEDYEDARRAFLLGRMVYQRRHELGLSQVELADRAGMTQPQLSRLEGGGVTPTIPLLERLAAALDVDLVIDFAPRMAA
ncbi:helix-turn-helix domain-containing protein [Glycomyces sp. NEAU-7082]|jgi:transcriptional regulator with XRE-family HTH domain|uniref:Helix-turn-helix domain-containing protein n=2 Tax=Glycomyces albidus TaxID=2656774 RepID=A0A6L5G7W4_9ACTN|nr:helix-turn-helix domain-containing protein [Glycomyces albidus]